MIYKYRYEKLPHSNIEVRTKINKITLNITTYVKWSRDHEWEKTSLTELLSYIRTYPYKVS